MKKNSSFHVSSIKVLFPFIASLFVLIAASIDAFNPYVNMELVERIVLISMPALNIGIIYLVYRVVKKPKFILNDEYVKIRGTLGNYESIPLRSVEFHHGQDFIDIKNLETSKVVHLSQGSFSSDVWDKLKRETTVKRGGGE